MRNRRCRRPARADFGTGIGPLSSLVPPSSSLPAGRPCIRATSRASPSRLLDIVTFFRQDTTFNVGHPITDFWEGLTLDGRLASGGGPRIQVVWALIIDLRETPCVTRRCVDHCICDSIQKLRFNQTTGVVKKKSHLSTRTIRQRNDAIILRNGRTLE